MNFDSEHDKALAQLPKPIQRILIISFDRIAKTVCEFHLREMGFCYIDHVRTVEEGIVMGLEYYALVIRSKTFRHLWKASCYSAG